MGKKKKLLRFADTKVFSNVTEPPMEEFFDREKGIPFKHTVAGNWRSEVFKNDNPIVLELGCGRGEFLNEFVKNGLEGHGVDLSDYSKNFFSNLNFKKVDMDNEKLPYEDNFFDIIYSKSFIEHFYHPERDIFY